MGLSGAGWSEKDDVLRLAEEVELIKSTVSRVCSEIDVEVQGSVAAPLDQTTYAYVSWTPPISKSERTTVSGTPPSRSRTDR